MIPGRIYAKDNTVRLWAAHPELLEALARIARVLGAVSLPVVVTSLNDAKHRRNSLHYEGRAADIRSKVVPRALLDQVLASMRAAAGKRFDLILEARDGDNEHFHLELDPKGEPV